MKSRLVNSVTGADVYFKCENFQRVGAFKFRGAYNALSQLTPAQRANGVLAFSSGNHAQAVALAARLLDIKAVIIMPTDAPKAKRAATADYGAEIITYERDSQDREGLGRDIAEERNMTLIPPYDHPHVIAGQGTTAKEFLDEVGELDMLVVPLGGGGLLSGCAVSAAKLSPSCAVIGVEPEAGNDGQQSLRAGEIVHIDTPQTIADGAQTHHLGNHTFPIIHELVSDIVTVSDAELMESMALFASRMKIIVEPTGCLGAAAVLTKKVDAVGMKVGIIVSGGNVDLDRFANFVTGTV
jgi:threo-3-hydroxy-L-aspartate ammonia-lyase